MTSLRDYQRQRLYNWENQAWFADVYTELMTLEEIEALAKKLIPGGVTVRDGRRRRRAAGSYVSSTIWMPKWSRLPHFVCHEVAHTIVHPSYHSAHGPRFVREYINCLYKAKLIGSREACRMDAIDYGLDVGRFA